ncbi:MAG: alpha/beta hydrolase, partial [Usitatibacteraceae bacterium]
MNMPGASASTGIAVPSATVYTPTTVSNYWRDFWATFNRWPIKAHPAPGDIAGWDALREQVDELIASVTNPNSVSDLKVSVVSTNRNGVPVVHIRPATVINDRQVLIYLHGGAYTFQSADSTLLAAGLMANATNLSVVSVDYTVAPRGKWNVVTNEVLAVYRSLLDEGYAGHQIGIFGDSAGGGLATGATLKMRDLGLSLPAALVLWS